MAQLFQRRDPIERFIEKIDFTDDCWLWTASKDKHGYGSFHPTHDTETTPYRFGWKTFVGPIPEGLELDHLCLNPSCVNPDHLEPVAHIVNIRRSGNTQKTECINGHAYTPENTEIHSGGKRRCRICRNARRRTYYARNAR